MSAAAPWKQRDQRISAVKLADTTLHRMNCAEKPRRPTATAAFDPESLSVLQLCACLMCVLTSVPSSSALLCSGLPGWSASFLRPADHPDTLSVGTACTAYPSNPVLSLRPTSGTAVTVHTGQQLITSALSLQFDSPPCSGAFPSSTSSVQGIGQAPAALTQMRSSVSQQRGQGAGHLALGVL